MSRNIGNIEIPFSFEPTSQSPLDSRLVVETQSDLTAPETYFAKNYYKGMTVTVKEDGSIWTLMDPENITSLDSWIRQTSGEGASDIIVVDNLTTDNGSNALSARQGKVLGEKIQEILDSKGEANGIATLGEDGKVPSSQLPSYVDDVLEFDTKEDFPEEGETGKIYVDKSTNTTWRWGGTEYANVGSSLALGETSETAFAGDKGKALQEKVEGIEETIEEIKNSNSDLETALGNKVEWNEDKKTISVPKDGGIIAEKGEEKEPVNLISQDERIENGERIPVTKVGNTSNETTLFSADGEVKVVDKEGKEDTLAKSGEVYKYINDMLSWYEETGVAKWDGVSTKAPAYDSETGTYFIVEPSEFAWLMDNNTILNNPDVIIDLNADIDLNNNLWSPIGDKTGVMSTNPNARYFKGVLNGNGYTVYNLNCDVEDDYAKVGLFASVQGATIKDLTIDGATLKTTHYAGAFAGYNRGEAVIFENCIAKNITIIDTPAINEAGELDNGDKAGGIIGYLSAGGSKIIGCRVENTSITAYRDLGGLVGYVGSNKITVDIKNNTLLNVALTQDTREGYKEFSKIEGHVGNIYGWKDNNTVNLEGNTGEATITVIMPESSDNSSEEN